jgi:hypothetical protein
MPLSTEADSSTVFLATVHAIIILCSRRTLLTSSCYHHLVISTCISAFYHNEIIEMSTNARPFNTARTHAPLHGWCYAFLCKQSSCQYDAIIIWARQTHCHCHAIIILCSRLTLLQWHTVMLSSSCEFNRHIDMLSSSCEFESDDTSTCYHLVSSTGTSSCYHLVSLTDTSTCYHLVSSSRTVTVRQTHRHAIILWVRQVHRHAIIFYIDWHCYSDTSSCYHHLVISNHESNRVSNDTSACYHHLVPNKHFRARFRSTFQGCEF